MDYKVIYAIYDREPIPCEGDDPITDSIVIYVSRVNNTIDYLTMLGMQLSQETGNYYSVWDIQENL